VDNLPAHNALILSTVSRQLNMTAFEPIGLARYASTRLKKNAKHKLSFFLAVKAVNEKIT
jgi:hypothetical protein